MGNATPDGDGHPGMVALGEFPCAALDSPPSPTTS